LSAAVDLLAGLPGVEVVNRLRDVP